MADTIVFPSSKETAGVIELPLRAARIEGRQNNSMFLAQAGVDVFNDEAAAGHVRWIINGGVQIEMKKGAVDGLGRDVTFICSAEDLWTAVANMIPKLDWAAKGEEGEG